MEITDMEGLDGRTAYMSARDRAWTAAVLAKTIEEGQAAWRLMKAHHQCAMEYGRAERSGLEFATSRPHACQGGGSFGRDGR